MHAIIPSVPFLPPTSSAPIPYLSDRQISHPLASCNLITAPIQEIGRTFSF